MSLLSAWSISLDSTFKQNKYIHPGRLSFYDAICSVPVKARDWAPVKVAVRTVPELSGDAPT